MTDSASPQRSAFKAPRRHAFAGIWLVITGLLNLLIINLMIITSSDNFAWSSLDWSAVIIVLLGICVFLRAKIAIVMARLLGSMAIVFLIFATLSWIFGFGTGQLNYGNTTIVDSAPWQLGLVFFAIAATLLPPWWALQRAFADNCSLH